MTAEALTLNGVSLASLAYMTTDISSLLTAPARRGDNVVVPGRHGAIPSTRKRFTENEFVLPLWIVGALADGSIPAGSTDREELFKRRDELLRLLYANPLVVAYTRPTGLAVQATCEVVDVLDFTRVAAEPFAKVTVAVRNPGAFWFESSSQTATITGATGTSSTLSAFATATAPMENLTITFGPCSNPTITQGSTSFTYNGVISAGRQLVVNTAAWTLGIGTGSAWTPSYASVAYAPGPVWFSLNPAQSLSVGFAHTGGGSATVTIAGPRAYLSA